MQHEFTWTKAFYYTAECSCCGAKERSSDFPGEPTPTLDDEFTRRLTQRGWNIHPLLCKKCRIRLVLGTVEEMLDADQMRAGEGLCSKE
jgi:hypothetical protein